MSDEVLKILEEKDWEYDEPINLKDYDILDILAEEEVEFEFLFPEEFAKKQHSFRYRLGSIYGKRNKKEVEDGTKDISNEKNGMDIRSSRLKTVELSNEDYQEVSYLKDLLNNKRPKRLDSSIRNYTFTDRDGPLLQIGSKKYGKYDPPEISADHPYIPKFSTYFELFSSKPSKEEYIPKWNLENTLSHNRSEQEEIEETQSSTTLEIVRSSAETKERSVVDSNVVDASWAIEQTSRSFLSENMKTYKQTENGLPNALAITDRYIIVGMSKSQLMVFPNKTANARDSGVTSIYAADSPEDESEEFEIGSNVNGSDVGSVLSISVDSTETLCAVGYSGGNFDIINIEKQSVLKTVSDVHVTAVVFVKFLSNNSILSVDYDGNVNITSFNKKRFGTNVNSTRIVNRKQFGQIVDVSLIPYSVRMKHEDEVKDVAVDLVALTSMEQTVILTVSNNQANVLFTLKRDPLDVSSTSDKYDAKTKYVNNSVSTAFFRNDDNSFLFARCDDSIIDTWLIHPKLDKDNRLQYYIKQISRYTISNLVYSCFFLSSYHLYCVLSNSEVIIIDLRINQIVRSMQFDERKRFIFGNVNKKLQKVMRTVDESGPEVKGIVANNRVFTNCTCTSSNAAFILCFNELITVNETNLEQRYQKYSERNDALNALAVGVNYVNSLHKQLESANEMGKDDKEIRIRYYGFVNRLSSSALRVVEQTELDPLDRLGSAFDVLSNIEREDLIFTSVFSCCSSESDLTPDRFFSVLTEYIKAHRIDHISPAILSSYLDYLKKNYSVDEWYEVEKRLLHLNYASNIDEMIAIYNQYSMLFIVTSLYVNGKGDYISPIRSVYQAIESETNLDYFCHYPCVVKAEKSIAAGLQALYSYFLFLLYTSVHGVSLTGSPLNSLGRISNQNDCFSFLTQAAQKESHLHKLLVQFPDYVLSLLFYALSVPAISPPQKASESDDEEALHAAIERENYKTFYTLLAKTITSGLVNCLTLRDLPSTVTDQMMFLLLDLMAQWYVDSLSDSFLVFLFKYLENNSHLLKREKLRSIIELYPFSNDTIDAISFSLLSMQCVSECVLLFEKEQRYDKVLQLYFSEIREETDLDVIHSIALRIEEFLAKVIMKEREKGNRLKRLLSGYFIPLLYLDSSIFSYYLLVIAEGRHQDILQSIKADEQALFYYLQHFLTPSETPTLQLSSSLLKSILKSQSGITEDDQIQFASLLFQKQKSLLLSFIQFNSLSHTAAQAIYDLASAHHLQSSADIHDVSALCLLYHLTGKTEEALQTVSKTLNQTSEVLKQTLRSLFNIKDLEKPFLCLQQASQIITIFSQIFPAITSDLDYERLQETYLQEYWQGLLYEATELISQVRKALTLKIDMNGNHKIIAGLELLESTASAVLQQVLDSLQIKVPQAVLLTCVLNQNSGNTVHDISDIVSKVIENLQMEIEGYDKYMRIYRRDYNECLHQKAELIKQPFLFQFSHCFACKGPIVEGEECRAFVCGHVYHALCSEGKCSHCEKLQTTTKRRNERYAYLPLSRQDTVVQARNPNETSPIERWKKVRNARREQEEGSLYSIYNTMYENRSKFVGLMKVPSTFSSHTELPDVSADLLVGEPQVGSLPVAPYMKGECVLLPNNLCVC